MKRLRPTDDDVRRRLPLDDASVDALDERTRRRLGVQWASRATAELRVASIFASISRDLLVAGADPAVLRIVTRAVSDEVRHAEICRLLAARYLAREVPWPPPGAVPMPELAKAPDAVRPTLHVVAMGCINETIATAWLEVSRDAATAQLPRAALRELIADDVHHARMGWAHLASPQVPASARKAVAAWLDTLLEAAAAPWLRPSKDTIAEGLPEHGVPSLVTTRAVVRETLREVVLPGLEQVGVSAARGRAWYARAFEREPVPGGAESR